MSSEDYALINALAIKDAKVLEDKGKTYGDSWKARGGVGAFMMLARKWDRIENVAESYGWDIFRAARCDTAEVDGVLDDIADLRRYLLLVEAEVLSSKARATDSPPWGDDVLP